MPLSFATSMWLFRVHVKLSHRLQLYRLVDGCNGGNASLGRGSICRMWLDNEYAVGRVLLPEFVCCVLAA